MEFSKEGIVYLDKVLEGKEYSQYIDSGGEQTIGVGHLITAKEQKVKSIVALSPKGIAYDVKLGVLSDEDVYGILRMDVRKAVRVINMEVKPTLNQDQFDSLVCFIFNIGVSAFKKSTLLKTINAGDYSKVPTQMIRWVFDNGEIVQGLINRRVKEICLWNGKPINN